ncbi:hypothetical protein NB640_12345 [Oxalobacter vibrioformis]|uniref:Uncharacterized protein n=1 Tax=Oxalobacter vibrioformis TaxID=933080 RepID=A0A9E9P397_9BURK|nr:hypothetical protein [Oxalobacter vibrioformis]WAW09990.1 hypothetical protein NB640_12345 [Oxalobacter vibrioformis]
MLRPIDNGIVVDIEGHRPDGYRGCPTEKLYYEDVVTLSAQLPALMDKYGYESE